jgi:hypothetical protein
VQELSADRDLLVDDIITGDSAMPYQIITGRLHCLRGRCQGCDRPESSCHRSHREYSLSRNALRARLESHGSINKQNRVPNLDTVPWLSPYPASDSCSPAKTLIFGLHLHQ